MGVRRLFRRFTVDLSSVGGAEVGPVAGVSLERVTRRVGFGAAGGGGARPLTISA